jgi:hypothetical protein
MKKLFLLVVGAAMLMASGALAAPVLVTQPSPGYGGRNGGGEFNISPNFTGGVYGPDVAIFGGFQTFCVEAQVDIVVPGNYNAALSSQDANGTQLTLGTAWLYQMFATENPALSYNYTPGAGRTDAAGELQQAIWILQGQGGPNVVETAATSANVQLAVTHFGSLANAEAPNNGFIPVSIVNLTDANGVPVQNMLSLSQNTCDCSLTFDSPTTITKCAGEAIPDVTASQVCGNGQPVNVPVTFVGSVTNGDCPKIVTRTYTAVDGCRKLQTFVQTITINCEPDCTLTASVTVTAPGASGLTASVADLGPGANYFWTIDDGTITIGQGTPKITWTAGTDTSKSVTITVTESTVAGCMSKCHLVVPFTPTGLGHGDTATIGFWHNKNGQGLILGAPNSPALGNWLGSNYPCMFGNLAGKPNSVVAAQFLTYFGVSGKKTQAQVMAGALAVYFTTSSLGGGSASAGYGFNVTPGGTGSKTYNVGTLGTALGLQNNTSYTVLQLLQAANSHCPFNSTVYDALNDIFNGINQKGDI